MGVSVSYPGVYIEEMPSGQHTITGVATSIAAFIGWSNKGPVGEALMVESWAEYQATFGGMIPGVYLGYSVYQFFLNGGQLAYIVRLVDPATALTASSTIGNLPLYAANPGAWGNSVYVTITNVVTVGTVTTFNLQVTQQNPDGTFTTLESYTNLSTSPTASQYALTVIDNDSNYITFVPPGGTAPTSVPAPTAGGVTATALNGGSGTVVTGADGNMLAPSPAGTSTFETQLGSAQGYQALSALAFNILCVPGETSSKVVPALEAFCNTSRAILIVDADQSANGTSSTGLAKTGPADAGGTTLYNNNSINAAFYYPWVLAADPMVGNRPTLFPPSGFVAGMFAATDASRGVWKAPAGIGTALTGALGLQTNLTDLQQGFLNQLAVNCLRQFPNFGTVIWGSRTIAGSDALGSQWKHIPIRRLALFIESSLYQGTQWAVFEPNSEPLWGQVRLSIGTFMQGLFLQGAFAGSTPQQAYFVKCDDENNPDSSVALGILNITVGFAPLYPAEFVIIQIQQMINQS